MNKNINKLWSGYFILICLSALFMSFTMNMLNSVLSLFANDMWSSKTLGGYLTTTFNIGSIVMALFCGRLVDRYGRRRCLIAGSASFAFFTAICAVWAVPFVSLPVRVIQGMAKSVVFVASSSIVADIVPRERMTEGLGFYGLGSTITMALGPMVALAVINASGYSMMFILGAVFLLICCGFGSAIRYEKQPFYRKPAVERAGNKSANGNDTYKGIWKFIEKKALLASIMFSVFFGTLSCILVFITVYSTEILEMKSFQISMFYILAAVAMFFTRMFLGRITDKFGALLGLIPGHIAAMLSMLLLAYSAKNSYSLYLISGVLYGLALSAVMPTMNAIAVVDSPKTRSGIANATYYCLMDIGMMICSALFGTMIDKSATPLYGYRIMFMTSSGICAAALLISIALFNNKARGKRSVSVKEESEPV